MPTSDPTPSLADTASAAAPLKKQFPCKQCGAKLDFDPGAAALKCPYCSAENAIPQSEADIRELDFAAYLAQLDQQPAQHETLTVRCDGCGARTTLDANVVADACPFCGANVVASAQSQRLIQPKALLPFAITREQAQAAFGAWLAGRWFAPSDLLRYAQTQGKLAGLYVPYWTYDSHTVSFYRGQRGDDYWVTEHYTTVENGKHVTKTRQVRRTRWTSVSGTVWNNFDDVLVLASDSLPEKYAQSLEPWDLHALVPYADEYLSGFRAQSYQVDLAQGFETAKGLMAPAIHQAVERDIGGDHQRVDSIRTQYDQVTFKHVLLPIWLSAYRYRQEVYRILINARTGEVQGQRPYSAWKIVGAVLAGLALAAAAALVILSVQS